MPLGLVYAHQTVDGEVIAFGQVVFHRQAGVADSRLIRMGDLPGGAVFG